MTDKQGKILNAALELFANDGYTATSTSKIAKKAGVSEGLIFRHFQNKEGLLQAIIKEAEEKIKVNFADVIFEADPKEVIRKTLNLSNALVANKADADFWKFQYKIKWEIEKYGEQKMEPLQLALSNAFSKLGYESPGLEAKLLLINMDGMATRYFLQENFNIEEMIAYLHSKYKI